MTSTIYSILISLPRVNTVEMGLPSHNPSTTNSYKLTSPRDAHITILARYSTANDSCTRPFTNQRQIDPPTYPSPFQSLTESDTSTGLIPSLHDRAGLSCLLALRWTSSRHLPDHLGVSLRMCVCRVWGGMIFPSCRAE